MATLPLQYYPAPLLRRVAEPVVDFSSPKLRHLVSHLADTMRAAAGIGLAAPQIGVSQRVIVVSDPGGLLALVNPEILDFSRRRESGEEGCLSIPGVFGWVKRPWRVTVAAWTPAGQPVRFTAEALTARIIQHEVDHCNGILFIDRVHQFTAGESRLSELWRQHNR
jgi:peptide deformylase